MKRRLLLKCSIFLPVVLLAAISFSAECRGAEEIKSILSIEAHDMLNTLPDTYLIDVRTRAEYQLVGHPPNAYLFPYLFMTETLTKDSDGVYTYQMGPKNKSFVDEIGKMFKKSDNLLIIGRDGTRSALAAKELAEAGYKNIYHVEDGFEGADFPYYKDENRHKFYRQLAKRNKIQTLGHRRQYGWQWWGLPWTYEIDPKYLYPPDLEGLKNGGKK
jgi:rhodanese-related sulfurtransferase